MHISVSLRILGILLMLFSTAMLAPLIMALLADDHTSTGFFSALGITFLSGLLICLPGRNAQHDLRIRDGVLITSLFWTVLGVFGALPFYLNDFLNLTPTEAIFESISGLTTTGATVIVGLDDLPQSILIYRQLLQWLGGIGIIVVAVAVLPMLGIGGMQLYKAETPGPSKDSKLTPRITQTAKALASVYVALTLACAAAYYVAGMTGFDAIAHAFSTVAIGGFSTHDASMGYFENDNILLVCSIFMCFSAINFGLHFMAWRHRSGSVYRKDSETRFFLSVLLVCVGITCAYLMLTGTLGARESITHGVFQAISITTTTGFATQNFALWPSFLPVMMLFFSFMGGCVGSTGGGIKAMRLMLDRDEPADYVVATGESHSVREFCEIAFDHVGLDYQKYVVRDERFYRPAEVDLLISDPSKARSVLGWEPSSSFKELVTMMVDADLELLGSTQG